LDNLVRNNERAAFVGGPKTIHAETRSWMSSESIEDFRVEHTIQEDK
jgi:hypothetical protein